MVARCKEDILKARGVKPTLSPNLNVLATVEALDVKKLLFIGVGCQVSPRFECPSLSLQGLGECELVGSRFIKCLCLIRFVFCTRLPRLPGIFQRARV